MDTMGETFTVVKVKWPEYDAQRKKMGPRNNT